MLPSYKQIGQNHIHFNEIDSTNTFAVELLSKTNPIDGTVISADFQSNGKGQYDRIWHSNHGENIIMSIILFPDFLPAYSQTYLSLSIALGIHDYLSSFDTNFFIKWPNDLYYKDNKISGILIQNQLQGQMIKSSVVGIGLNLNQLNFTDINANITSLKNITSIDFDIEVEMKKLWQNIGDRYNHLAAMTDFNLLKNEYESKMYCIGKKVKFKALHDENWHIANIIGIDDNGRLSVALMNGLNQKLVHGEVMVDYTLEML
jgi:BirA family transcriptional regulator, biotin operon repressor / biotin---[acetyl-CoA-carboxylase] ligase